MSLVLIVLIMIASISMAVSVITTNSMARHCFKSIDRYLEETLEEMKKVTLDALEEMKHR